MEGAAGDGGDARGAGNLKVWEGMWGVGGDVWKRGRRGEGKGERQEGRG